MTSRSRSPIDAARAGFTLPEVLIAGAIGITVLVLVTNMYIGANKAQALAVGGSYLKQSADGGLRDIYRTLKSAKKIFDRNTGTNSWMARTDLKNDLGTWNTGAGALTPQVESAKIVLPKIRDEADFWLEKANGSPNPDLANLRAAAGNTLFFVANEPKAHITEPTSGNKPLTDVYGTTTFQFPAYRLHLYYIANRSLGTGATPVRPGASYTQQLMHWRSRPYLDYLDVKNFLVRVKTAGLAYDPNAWLDTKMSNLATDYAGAIDLTAASGALTATPAALHLLSPLPTNHVELADDTTTRFIGEDLRTALTYNTRNSFAECMVAFNTTTPTDNSYPGVKLNVPEHVVPSFADAGTNMPFGFEVLVGGPPNTRQVLVRLTLAARSNSGGKATSSYMSQQIVQVFEN